MTRLWPSVGMLGAYGAELLLLSVVLKAVPNNVTVAGVPAKVVGEAGCPEPSRAMDQFFHAMDI